MIFAMATIDPEQERQRLAELYSSKTDMELEQVAEEADGLTDIAREALRTELTKRGLYIGQLDDRALDEESAEFRSLVVIRTFWNLLEAELAKGLLDSAGVEAFLFDDNMVRLDWFNANALGGVKLRVDASNVEAANRILNESISDAAAAEEADSTD
jgi:sporulation protein YlmC with PRC-barrel domain